MGRDDSGTLAGLKGPPAGAHRTEDRRVRWPDRQDHRRRLAARVPQRRRRGALRGRRAARHG